jgi:sialidase-1
MFALWSAIQRILPPTPLAGHSRAAIRQLAHVVVTAFLVSLAVLGPTGCALEYDEDALEYDDWSADSTFAASGPGIKVFESEYSQQMGTTLFYRIPSIVTVRDSGALVAFAERRVGSNEDSGNVDVVYKYSRDNGSTWSKLYVLCNLGPNKCGNPTAVVDQRTGLIHVFMASNPGHLSQLEDDPQDRIGPGDRHIKYATVRITPTGTTKSPVEDLTQQVGLPSANYDLVGPGVGIQLTSVPYRHRLVIPALRRTIYSDDGGKTWKKSPLMAEGGSETAIVELSDGRIYRNDRPTGSMRDKKRRVVSFSSDGGRTFTTPSAAKGLVDPVCEGSLLRYAPERILFANCKSTTNRKDLTIRWGITARDFSSGFKVDGDCGYSSMTKTADYHVGILYEANNHSISGSRKAPKDLVLRKFKVQRIVDAE